MSYRIVDLMNNMLCNTNIKIMTSKLYLKRRNTEVNRCVREVKKCIDANILRSGFLNFFINVVKLEPAATAHLNLCLI